MKKLLFAIVCMAGVLFAAEAQAKNIKASGKVVTEERNVNGFTGVSSSAGIDVYITPSPAFSVTVKTDSNAVDYVETKVKDGVLHIGYRSGVSVSNKISTAVYVSMPAIDFLEASSGSDIKVKGVIEGESLKISASSAAEIKAIAKYRKVSVSSSSGAEVELKGNAEECKASASSGADIDLKEMVCRNASASASSGADIDIYVTGTLRASASSGADVDYYGNPEHIEISKSSGGSVTKK